MLVRAQSKESVFTDLFASLISKEEPTSPLPIPGVVGIYEVGHHNGSHQIQIKEEFPELIGIDGQIFPEYGVCDNYAQILYQCPEIQESNKNYVILLTKINKNDQPSSGGWRWHKWGEYIGIQEPQCEYLYDESYINHVYCYNVYEV